MADSAVWGRLRSISLQFTVCYIVYYFAVNRCSCQDEIDEFLLCRGCGHEVTKADDLVVRPSKLATRQRNDTILGKQGLLIQLFENPQGQKFEVITSKVADVYKKDQAYADFSWFTGYLWRIIVCPRCGMHLGWSFEPHHHKDGKKDTPETFIGLILENLLHKDYADSLLITPKSYYS